MIILSYFSFLFTIILFLVALGPHLRRLSLAGRAGLPFPARSAGAHWTASCGARAQQLRRPGWVAPWHGVFPDQEIKLHIPALAGGFLPTAIPGTSHPSLGFNCAFFIARYQAPSAKCLSLFELQRNVKEKMKYLWWNDGVKLWNCFQKA